MYEITCPYCKKEDHPMEAEGAINLYVGHRCESCKKIYYILQRSWFDPFYDNHDVEVRKESWIKKRSKELTEVGHSNNDKECKAYRPSWDIYEKVGGKDKAMETIKNLFTPIP